MPARKLFNVFRKHLAALCLQYLAISPQHPGNSDTPLRRQAVCLPTGPTFASHGFAARSRANGFAILFVEGSLLFAGQYFQYQFAWAAELGTQGGDNDWPVHQDRVQHHEVH
jgi:hypothetical protein